MLFLLKLFLAIICAIMGTLIGCHWINKLYQSKKNILSFPHKTSFQSQKRPIFLFSILSILFTLYLFSNPFSLRINAFELVFIYFLVLFTYTDLEQQVIFDYMLFPFALLGFLTSTINNLSLLDQLIAALGGGTLFLILAILTHGGIGGGDIKLIAALGLWLGIHQLADVITMGLIAGGIGAFLLLKFKHKKRTDTFAYGPYFTITALILLFLK